MFIDGYSRFKNFNRNFQSKFSKVFKENPKPLILSLHTGFMQADYTPIEKLKKQEVPQNETLYKITLENIYEKRFNLICSSETKFFVNERGFIPVEKINGSHVFIDDELRQRIILSNLLLLVKLWE